MAVEVKGQYRAVTSSISRCTPRSAADTVHRLFPRLVMDFLHISRSSAVHRRFVTSHLVTISGRYGAYMSQHNFVTNHPSRGNKIVTNRPYNFGRPTHASLLCCDNIMV